jgi:hypothetical protein
MEHALPKPFVRDRQFPTFWGPLRVAYLRFAQGVARRHHLPHGLRSSFLFGTYAKLPPIFA